MDKHQEPQQAEDLVYELLTELANLYLDLGQYDRAIEKFKKLIDLGETEASVYFNLSKAYLQTDQQSEEAQEVFEKTLALEPDNRVLAKKLGQIYLNNERIDQPAWAIYFFLLDNEAELFGSLSPKLIELALQKNEHPVIHELLNHFQDRKEKFNQLLMTYLKKSWQFKQQAEVGQYLVTLTQSEDSSFYSRLYMLNLIFNAKASADSFQLSGRDVEIYRGYLGNQEKFNSLSDLYLMLLWNRLFIKYPIRAQGPEKPSIEEYELFLASNSFDNIWELGLNKEEVLIRYLGIEEQALWQKLPALAPNGTGKEKVADEERIKEIFKRANSLLLVKAEKNTIDGIEKNVAELVATNAANFVAGFRLADGWLIFWENISTLITAAEALLKTAGAQKTGKNDGVENLQVVVQNISLARSKDFKYLFDDLEIALSILPFEDEVSWLSLNPSATQRSTERQLLISAPVKNLIEAECKLSILPSEIKSHHPVTAEEVPFFKLCWQDTLLKIKSGEIKQLGKFNINQELHPNQVFSSYKAVDSMLERLVVLKVLKPGFEVAQAKASTREIFVEQARQLGKLAHPGVALIYEVSEDRELSFIAREFVEGQPLQVIKKKNKKIDWKQAVAQVLKTAEALSFTHGKNIFHGRLKPDNIFVIESGDVKLTDFQLPGFSLPVKKIENIDRRALTYFAPELLEKYVPTAQSDVFALGVILYELISGQNPFLAETADKIFEELQSKTPEPVYNFNPDVPKKLNEIVLLALEKAPAKRFSDMEKFAAELRGIVGS